MTMMMNMGSQSSQSHTLRDTDGQDSPFSKLTLDMLRMLQDNCSKSSGDIIRCQFLRRACIGNFYKTLWKIRIVQSVIKYIDGHIFISFGKSMFFRYSE